MSVTWRYSDICLEGKLKLKNGSLEKIKVGIDFEDIYIKVFTNKGRIPPYMITDAIEFSFDLNEGNIKNDDSRIGCNVAYKRGGTYIQIELTEDSRLVIHAHDNLPFFSNQDKAREYLRHKVFWSLRVQCII